MKKVFFIFFFLFSLISIAQKTKAKITYTVSKINLDSTKLLKYKNNPSFKKSMVMFKKIDEISKGFIIDLIIDNETSYFSNTRNSLQVEESNPKLFYFAEMAYKVRDNFYYNHKNNELIVETERLGEKLLISKKPSQEKWVFKSKTKKIGKYECYQAHRIIEWTNSKGENKKTEQKVWYTTEIPLPFGPRNFVGFPGLVLQATIGKIQFTASKIILNPTIKLEIRKPKNGKRVSEEEYKKMSAKSIENAKAIYKN